MSPRPATITNVPSTIAIFLLIGQGLQETNPLEDWVIWSVSSESTSHAHFENDTLSA